MAKSKATQDPLAVEQIQAWYRAKNTAWRVGQRVRFSAYAVKRNIPRKYRGRTVMTGTVRAVILPTLIHVLRDGRKCVDPYFAGFWEPIPKRRSPLRRQAPKGGGR